MPAGDPYAPVAPTRPPPPSTALPSGRLDRLGASPATSRALEAWWHGLTVDQRRDEAGRLAGQSDKTVAVWLADLGELADASQSRALSWVVDQDPPERAAQIALQFEAARPRGRRTLREQLLRIAKGDQQEEEK